MNTEQQQKASRASFFVASKRNTNCHCYFHMIFTSFPSTSRLYVIVNWPVLLLRAEQYLFSDNIGISQIELVWLLIRRWITVLIRFIRSRRKLRTSLYNMHLPRKLQKHHSFRWFFYWLITSILIQWFISGREARIFLPVLADSPVAAQQQMPGKPIAANAAKSSVTVASSQTFPGSNP